MTTVPYYDSAARGAPFVREFRELLRYRDLLRLLVANSIKTRYKRSVLGVVWTLLNPLLTMAVLTIVFSSLFRFSLTNYPVYLLSGLLLWGFFAQTTTAAMHSLVWGGGLLKRVYIPRTIFSVSAIATGLVNLLLALGPLALIMLILGHPFRLALLFLPVGVLLTAMFALGVGLILSALAVLFVDVVDMYQVLLTAGLYLTPVIYPEEILPAPYAWTVNLNPMHHLIELFRAPIYLGALPGPNTILAAVASAVLSLLIGWWVFTRKADELAYRI